MTRQASLYDPMLATVRTRQGELFTSAPAAVGLRCPDCERHLVETESGYLCCPAGHGKLIPNVPDEDDGEE
jgi:hypothetical protein